METTRTEESRAGAGGREQAAFNEALGRRVSSLQLLEEARRLEAAIATVAADTQRLATVKADVSSVTLLQKDVTDLAHVQVSVSRFLERGVGVL